MKSVHPEVVSHDTRGLVNVGLSIASESVAAGRAGLITPEMAATVELILSELRWSCDDRPKYSREQLEECTGMISRSFGTVLSGACYAVATLSDELDRLAGSGTSQQIMRGLLRP